MSKQLGFCSFCGNKVRANIEETNFFRRDRCSCPECSETIYVCRNPICDNYTKGGDIYDDELCIECDTNVSETFSGITESIKSGHESNLKNYRNKNETSLFELYVKTTNPLHLHQLVTVLKEKGCSDSDLKTLRDNRKHYHENNK
ncbi:hypothetical protein [Psychromonas sp. Urea-02u-13]|uniref:hypothetical protein n=1 Tax=Psychromonas sp. Urea-02u-13 TaxID=2058326 RepID=UPI000C336F8D|nr:hypothetical protein [Psychromonas sp. Urea-02u-13]PKG37668.1 hypothetical protein CXF74_17635 [Psychromonas sp. Urea-02u-13]